MSVDYSILCDSKEPIDVVKTQLEQIINSQFKLSENWDYYDLYYVEVLGLWIQFHDWRESAKHYQDDEEDSQFTYQVQVGYVRKITGLLDGKDWERIAIVELARMISRNLKCKAVVMAQDVMTHRFEVD
jgi:hypothetical protein